MQGLPPLRVRQTGRADIGNLAALIQNVEQSGIVYRIGFRRPIVHLVYQQGHGQSGIALKSARRLLAFGQRLRVGNKELIRVGGTSPACLFGVRLLNIDQRKVGLRLEIVIELSDSPNRSGKGRSSTAPEDIDARPAVFGGKGDSLFTIRRMNLNVGGKTAHLRGGIYGRNALRVGIPDSEGGQGDGKYGNSSNSYRTHGVILLCTKTSCGCFEAALLCIAILSRRYISDE